MCQLNVLRETIVVYTIHFAIQSDLFSLKLDIDELDIDKLKNVASGLNRFRSYVSIRCF